MADRSKITAILTAKCPRCREGEVFKYSAFNLPKFDRMHEDCPVCGLHYEVEVGFFWGAMYISYSFSVGIVLAVGILLYYLANDPPTWVYLAVVSACVIILTPILFRYARILMLHFFSGVKYDPSFSKH
ncbi:DUF983 domain-containing protein [Pontibacter ruber]|uniref:DUF983 domain-containing protein n=1 Tax=Pontibacter ruber TaxID=1343895 RepID=A0ABW5CTP4_9BACT|nr:DUF983 domain-containing protein [Pontibacter ruber]